METRGYLKILWRSDGGGYNADVIGVQSRPRTWAGRQRAAPPAHVRDGYQAGPGFVVGGEGARGVAGMTTNGACRRSRRRLGMSLVVGTPAAAWTVGPGSSRGCRGTGRGSHHVLIRSPRRTVHPRLPTFAGAGHRFGTVHQRPRTFTPVAVQLQYEALRRSCNGACGERLPDLRDWSIRMIRSYRPDQGSRSVRTRNAWYVGRHFGVSGKHGAAVRRILVAIHTSVAEPGRIRFRVRNQRTCCRTGRFYV